MREGYSKSYSMTGALYLPHRHDDHSQRFSQIYSAVTWPHLYYTVLVNLLVWELPTLHTSWRGSLDLSAGP